MALRCLPAGHRYRLSSLAGVEIRRAALICHYNIAGSSGTPGVGEDRANEF